MAKEKILLVISGGVLQNILCTTHDIDICVLDYDNVKEVYGQNHPAEANEKAKEEIGVWPVEVFNGKWAETISDPDSDVEILAKERLAELDKEHPLLLPARYVSVWDGGNEIHTNCLYNPVTNMVCDVEPYEGDEDLHDCDEEYIIFKGKTIKTFHNEDDGQDYVDGELAEEVENEIS